MNRFFTYLDRISFMNINIWDFTYHSFFREYARFFLFKVMLSHPFRTSKGLTKYRRLMKEHKDILPKFTKFLSIPDEKSFFESIKKQRISPLVGLGFCLKPYNPEKPSSSCPSGRANHDCLYLDKGQTEAICYSCAIYRLGEKCLETGCKVYIMTSAKEIARDFLIPQINSEKFPSAILLLCPYSIQAIIPPLLICNIDMFLMAYNSGYCRDFQEWVSADRGIKEEITSLGKASWKKLLDLLSKLDGSEPQYKRFRREGNIFSCIT
ncbi:MAG: hypothetical protein JSV96_01510 [Candidatus Aminicenantes bacterium]|nr:MAG: hypothetical protein JSV96_01510 [Candidatus Aminicenantes bacterium]